MPSIDAALRISTSSGVGAGVARELDTRCTDFLEDMR
jgi:hypothetical protein